MREQLDQRLKQLKAEFEAGQRMLADLEAKQASVRETMLRISGAIQVLEELLAGAPAEGADGDGAVKDDGRSMGRRLARAEESDA